MSGIGRNDPCPCGSGRKYKKCCLAREPVTALAYAPAEREDALDRSDADLSEAMGLEASEDGMRFPLLAGSRRSPSNAAPRDRRRRRHRARARGLRAEESPR